MAAMRMAMRPLTSSARPGSPGEDRNKAGPRLLCSLRYVERDVREWGACEVACALIKSGTSLWGTGCMKREGEGASSYRLREAVEEHQRVVRGSLEGS
jgi:hypothetical protein